jgi:ketosteroid isomerase-like protein
VKRPAASAGSAVEAWVERERAAIQRLLESHLVAWNGGDLGPLLDTYVQDESSRYATAGTVVHGIDGIRERFRQAYPAQGSLGQLRYEDVDITVISRTDAIVFGRARISGPAESPEATSLFTLHMQLRGEGWRIVADHTSA